MQKLNRLGHFLIKIPKVAFHRDPFVVSGISKASGKKLIIVFAAARIEPIGVCVKGVK